MILNHDIYAYNCLINAYQMQNKIKLHVIQFDMLHSKGIKCTIHIHFNQS